MKLTKDQYAIFSEFAYQGIERRNPSISIATIKEFILSLNGEKLSHFNALSALKFARTDNFECWEWTQALNLNESHWATIGRKFFKDLVKAN